MMFPSADIDNSLLGIEEEYHANVRKCSEAEGFNMIVS
jgi:hypothetical protein